MADTTPIEKLQPCLLDRLTDNEPKMREEGRAHRIVSNQKYRRGVLRDLEWLFNTVGYIRTGDLEPFRLKDYPEAYRSVINYGTRQLCGVGHPDLDQLRADLIELIRMFEPRIEARSLVVKVDIVGNIITFRLEGTLWANPIPEQLNVKTSLDIETGLCVLGDVPNG